MKEFLYLAMIVVTPIVFCILIYRLKNRMPHGKVLIPIIMAIFILHTIIWFPLYMIAPVVADTYYELFTTFFMILKQFYIIGLIIVGLYIVSYIYMKKNVKFIIRVVIITILITLMVHFVNITLFKKREKPNDLYLKMHEIVVNDSLIGLSEKEVIKLLGKPYDIYENSNTGEKTYEYSGGTLYEGIIWGEFNIFTTKHHYGFSVDFDKTNKVESTSMREYT